jgi:membrane-associated phospholipid phosphatase
MKRNFSFLVVTFILAATNVRAQGKHEMDSLHDYCYICTHNEHLIIKPPYTKKFAQELPFIISSAAVFATGLTVSALDKTKPYTEEELTNNPPDVSSINSLDRGSVYNWSPAISTASDAVLLTVTVLPALFLSEHHTGRDIKTLLIMYAEVFTFNYGLTEIAKSSVNRARPYVYNPEVPMGTRTGSFSRKSFFSGHTSQTAAASFYFAKVITDYHPTLKKGLKIGLWAFAVTIPALNGTFRVLAGKHFPTDVMTGYVAGAATGWLIPQLHRTRASKIQKEQLSMGFIPYRGSMLMSLNYRF